MLIPKMFPRTNNTFIERSSRSLLARVTATSRLILHVETYISKDKQIDPIPSRTINSHVILKLSKEMKTKTFRIRRENIYRNIIARLTNLNCDQFRSISFSERKEEDRKKDRKCDSSPPSKIPEIS